MKNESAKIIIPPIKIQGIKSKLVPWIQDVMETSDISREGCWIEPFMGSGVVGFNAGRSLNRHLMCDTNPHIVRFYEDLRDKVVNDWTVRQALESHDRLLKMDGEAYYYRVREWFNRFHSPMTSFLFLSRACFNGLMRFNSKGGFNVPFCKKTERFSKAYITKICNQVKTVGEIVRSGDWEFCCQDFRLTIKSAQPNDFIYCDPPYFGRHVDYYNGWTEKDEEELFNLLSQTPAKFILSTWHHNDYRENEMITRFWNKFNITTHEHFYHIGASEDNRRGVTEALITNF